MVPPLKTIIRDNVRKLLGLAQEASGVSEVMRLGFANGTAQRILDDTTQVGVDQLERLAAGLRVEPWQLCVPNLQPDHLPTLEPRSFRWPFRSIDPEVVTSLVGTVAAQVENGLVAVLATAGVSPKVQAQQQNVGLDKHGMRYFKPPALPSAEQPAEVAKPRGKAPLRT